MRLHSPLLALAATAALAGCYVPSAPDEVLYGIVTSTNYKQDQASGQPDPLFASTTDVAVNDTIAIIDDTDSGVSISPEVQAGVINQIEKNLTERGYNVVAPGTAGALKVGAYALFGSVALYYSSYWCSYYYYYYCYPTVGYAGSYTVGTLLIEAGEDLYTPGQPPTPGQPSTLIWTAVNYGVMAGGDKITLSSPGYQKALGAIDQAFAQSPYFTRLP
jgi:hypothetical protein